jgi:DNA-directed RNA polymerase specialized sigma24 family protein
MISHKEQAATAKRWLNRSANSLRYIKALERRLNAFEHANITKYENTGAARVEPRENATETRMLEYSELCRLIDETRGTVDRTNAETLAVLDGLKSYLQKSILLERYINLLSWDDVARKVGYSTAHVKRLHGVALLALYQELKGAGLDD